MKTSPEIKQLAAALAKAQAKIEGATKDSTNPHFGKTYADLASVWETIREPLSSNGLSVVQSASNPNWTEKDSTVIVQDPRAVAVVTRLMHESGEWIEGTLSILPTKIDPQGVGSAITYARRYALAAMIGVYQIDDDANAASHPPAQRQAIETIGSEAQEVLAVLKAASTTIEKLYEAMTASGVKITSTDIAKWPKALLPRIYKWADLQKQIAEGKPVEPKTTTPVAERMKAVRGKTNPVSAEAAPV